MLDSGTVTVAIDSPTALKTSCSAAYGRMKTTATLASRLLLSASKPVSLPSRLDHVRHFPGLLLQLFHQLDVVVVAGPTCEVEQVVGFVPPRLEPVRTR